MDELNTILGFPSETRLIITRMDLLDWGRTLRFQGVAGDERILFTLTFDDCREIKWRVFAHTERGGESELADFAPGRDNHRSPAHLLADAFGITLVYGSLSIRREA